MLILTILRWIFQEKKMNKLFVLIALGFLLVLIFSSGGSQESNPVPWNRIEIREESNDSYIGSYSFQRCNNRDCWSETGEWSSDLELFFDRNKTVCFGYFSEGILYQSDGYHWVEVSKGGRNCVRLEKK